MLRTKKSSLQQANNLEDLHNNILDKITELDKLNNEYKNKLEEHFIKMFMNVLEKMGNDLILAQEAYRNIDIQVKRDKYIVQLAEELNFFKDECFTLKRQLKKMKHQVHSTRLDQETIKNQIKSIRVAYQKKSKECDHLKDINSQLSRQIKKAKQEEKDRILKLSHSDKDNIILPLQSERQNNFVWKQETRARWIKSHQAKRKMDLGKSCDPIQQFAEEKPLTISPTRTNQNTIKFRSTNPSSQHRSSQKKSKLEQTQLMIRGQ